MRIPGKLKCLSVGALALWLLVSGCGQSGPLYLPDDDAAQDVPAPGGATTVEDDEDTDDEAGNER